MMIPSSQFLRQPIDFAIKNVHRVICLITGECRFPHKKIHLYVWCLADKFQFNID